MIEIKEGPELDLRIASAVDLVCDVRDGKIFALFSGDNVTAFEEEFSPSTDLESAFLAAVMVDLFDGNWLGKLVTGWAVMELETREVIGPNSGCSTPALAICAAILKANE